jgi:hypothetical protein
MGNLIRSSPDSFLAHSVVISGKEKKASQTGTCLLISLDVGNGRPKVPRSVERLLGIE